MKEDKPYPTDEFGSPNGRDYHYRIPLNDDRAVRLASWALNGMLAYSDRFVVEWDGFSGDKLSYMGIQTCDRKGHLAGLAEYSHAPKWETIGFSGNKMEIRNGRGGGTRIKGTFRYDPVGGGCYRTLEYDTVVSQTPTEVKEASAQMGDTWDDIQESIHWAQEEAQEEYNEARTEFQRQCGHQHTIDETTNPEAVAYCEDCEAEVTESGEAVPVLI